MLTPPEAKQVAAKLTREHVLHGWSKYPDTTVLKGGTSFLVPTGYGWLCFQSMTLSSLLALFQGGNKITGVKKILEVGSKIKGKINSQHCDVEGDELGYALTVILSKVKEMICFKMKKYKT